MWSLPGNGYTIAVGQGLLACLLQTREVNPEPRCALRQLTGLASWHSYILSDLHLDSVPDIWVPQDSDCRPTPLWGVSSCCLHLTFCLWGLCKPGPMDPGLAETGNYQWSCPSKATKSCLSKEIGSIPLQFYKVGRLENVAWSCFLRRLDLGHMLEWAERWL